MLPTFLLFFLNLEYSSTFHQDLRGRFSCRFQVSSYWKFLGRIPPCAIVIPPDTILLHMSYNPSFSKAPSPFAFFPVFGFLSPHQPHQYLQHTLTSSSLTKKSPCLSVLLTSTYKTFSATRRYRCHLPTGKCWKLVPRLLTLHNTSSCILLAEASHGVYVAFLHTTALDTQPDSP